MVKMPHWIAHNWGPWVQREMTRTRMYIGHSYPAEVRGKQFTATVQVQERTCRVCHKVKRRDV